MCRKLLSFLFIFFLILCQKSFILSNNKFRDPFYLSVEQEKENLILSGLIKSGSNYGAVLEKTGESQVVFKGDTVWGFLVKEIGESFVVLNKGGRRIKLNS